ncbi:MAG: hypothetical protein ACYCWW_08520 [Deltaproteobacteria bacterium]
MSQLEIDAIFARLTRAPEGPPSVIELGDGREPEVFVPAKLPEGDEPLGPLEEAELDEVAPAVGHGR